MRTGRYTIAELFGNRHIEQLVIPEIQRDYVWKPEQVEKLMQSVLSNFSKWRRDSDERPLELNVRSGFEAPLELATLERDFLDFYARRTNATNVGFIYAYCDADLPGQYFLIDGQQRLTTIYLALLAVAGTRPDLRDRFTARYCRRAGNPMPATGNVLITKLDYRLREHTSDFLRRMVAFLLEHPGAAAFLREQSWFLAEATRDTSMQNLASNYSAIYDLLQPHLNEDKSVFLFEYIEELVECWYFDTNESAQGEELYLYLNARGETLADNENQKAALLGAIPSHERNEWGQQWEVWQDYFWTHRKEGLPAKLPNPSADYGFNSFLHCVDQLDRLRGRAGLEGREGLNSIQYYFSLLTWLEESKEVFKASFGYADWIGKWFFEFWECFNDRNVTDWSVSFGHEGRDRDQKRLTLAWGTLLSAAIALSEVGDAIDRLDVIRVFRAVRVFYLRFHNGGRALASLPKIARTVLREADIQTDKGDGLEEARLKWRFLKKFPKDERRRLEAVIWQIEDHKLNLDGENLGGVNLIHLVDLTREDLDLVQLKKIRDAFYQLFPVQESRADSSQKKKLACILISYGPFWDKVSPYYYANYNFGDWEKIVRGKGSAEAATNEHCFLRFFTEFVAAEEDLDQFLERKYVELAVVEIDPKTETSFSKAVLWYSLKLKEGLFAHGWHITEGHTGDKGVDFHFRELGELWNIDRYFYNFCKPLSQMLTSSPK